MSFVITTPELMGAAAHDLAGIGSAINAADAAAAAPPPRCCADGTAGSGGLLLGIPGAHGLTNVLA
ncbi:PE domain-containing protein [Mycobacterium lacus]|uniref:Uncharacterized protein n=1 Tax=Mycobacterium lacus TaxID=169765 RepID=A0A1X1YNE6_9MYCO|nr:PE domain-containing protein [Mycobacterium lacus]MCV7123992.1 PE family protein [Mycobacterium lacus]ORW12555.1 hypothetical protein AWC15_14960 [Mycobacterium lacus]BBX98139.1 hypothetical protein MLAC_34330 [Mycobacterium lacus]